MPIAIANIIAAPRHIDPAFLHTPLMSDAGLDEALGCSLAAKVETLNPIGSFKGRGTELFAATGLEPGSTVVCASAGNFGQGLARAVTRRGGRCVVFAAETANPLKLAAMRRLGGDVRLAGHDFDAAKAAALACSQSEGLRFVVDGDVSSIAEGAGTIATEILQQGGCETMVVPLGNGALLGGVGTVCRHLSPATEVVAVVAGNAPSMKLSLEAGRLIETERADTIADGIAVRVPVPSTIPALNACLDRIAAVDEETIRTAMLLIHRHLGLVTEPSGAVGVAAILAEPERYRGQRVATILCGRNIADPLRRELFGG